ncbi:Homer protein-like protein 3 [Larimichthys crocea]|uniref:Uncharacterized protein n=1 Tax=Larimichthys crocea TaxID=215358 RepID=A0ACD3QQU0_LARCR|nr:Homer protein-like protein 3 [Larimichthys crocea]
MGVELDRKRARDESGRLVEERRRCRSHAKTWRRRKAVVVGAAQLERRDLGQVKEGGRSERFWRGRGKGATVSSCPLCAPEPSWDLQAVWLGILLQKLRKMEKSCSGCSEPVEPAGGTLLSGCVRLLNASSRLDEEQRALTTTNKEKKADAASLLGDGHTRDCGHFCHRGQLLCLRRVVSSAEGARWTPVSGTGQDGTDTVRAAAGCVVPCRERRLPLENKASGSSQTERKRRPGPGPAAPERNYCQTQEQPIFSARAHVFQIDPTTKRNWIPASKHAVTVSFFYDANRNVYRIISVGGTKAIINCTVTPSMTFTKTSQKFGQWADSRANTVYGLGFATEQQLHQFSDKFKEVKDAARLAREKSQDKELANTALTIAAPQDLSDELQSPPVMCVNGPEDKLFRSQSADITLSSEKERIKKMLSEGSICEMNLEAELFTLQDSNSKLVAALHEANANVEQWKKQLAAYQEETDRLRDQVAELEAHGGQGPSDLLKDELTQSLEELEALLKAKDEEIHILQSKKAEYHEMEHERDQAIHRLRETEMRNSDLERRIQNSEQNLNNSLEERDRMDSEIQRAIEILDIKIFDLNDLRQSLVKLIDK